MANTLQPGRSGSRGGSSINHGSGKASSSTQSESPLEMESVEDHDFVYRRHRGRRSGGFLLDSAFPPTSSTRTPPRHGQWEDVDNKAKRKAHDAQLPVDSEKLGRLRRDNEASAGSSPLSREISLADYGIEENTRQNGATDERYSNQRHIAKSRISTEGGAAERTRAASPDAAVDHPPPSRGAIDPNQIVHMALNLSESRRRNLSAGQLVAPPASSSRRVTSANPPLPGSYQNYGTGGSLRQHFQQQRRASRNISPGMGRASPSASRQVSSTSARNILGPDLALKGQKYAYTFSDATLARRDKARAYIELSMEYLRLLQHLPPLKPDASAPGNFIVSTSNVQGTSNVQLSRVPSYANNKYGLGRPYNPLQFIRNRRTRARERKALEHVSKEFEDVEKVKSWVDNVEAKARLPGYRQEDTVMLPEFHEDHGEKDPLPGKPPRPRMGWTFSPPELFADAYWLEQNDNKSLIEDRYGNKIFTPKKQNEYLQPRSSKEYPEKRRKSWIEPILAGASSEPPTGEESDGISERGRKRRLLIPGLRGDGSGYIKKHGWRGSRNQSRSYSDASGSEDNSGIYKSRKPKRMASNEDNIGPLERHMKEMLEKEANEAYGISPSVGSPDQWGDGRPALPEEVTTVPDIVKHAKENGKAREAQFKEAMPRSYERGTDPVSSDSLREPRSSFEDLDYTEPNTPIMTNFLPAIGLDISPLDSRQSSLNENQKNPKLDALRSDGSVQGQRLEPEFVADKHKRGSRQTSGDSTESTGTNVGKATAPSSVKYLLTHKKNDSVGSLIGSPEKKSRKHSKDAKDTGSAVTRFFKGGRIGDIVRTEGSKVGEFIFRRDPPAEDSDNISLSTRHSLDSSESDEGSNSSKTKPRPKALSLTTTSATAGCATSKKNNGYHLPLPSFRSSAISQLPPSSQPDSDLDPAYATDSQIPDHHIYRQALARKKSRSPRFSRLAPPRMDMTSISTHSSPAPSRARSPSAARERLNAVLERPGTVGRGGPPATSLSKPTLSPSSYSNRRSNSRPNMDGKRHWSITDRSSPSRPKSTSTYTVTKADIARIRALLLCSGIKAREISRRASSYRSPPPAFLTRAAKTANAELIPVRRKEEHVLAARILVRSLETSTVQQHDSAERFRAETSKALQAHMAKLKQKVEDELFPRVRASGDEALAITGQVAGQAPLLVKEVSDKVDAMMRMRRRRMRWVRRIGWMLVEWVVLGVMWWVWFVVVLVRLARGFVVGIARGVRWLLWV
ncbi:hypothetical protein K432DRAFT_377049 [Lepidopterella palustris CBS 459.81]|uniref:Uncharacterized protein n=1 Tax=Lepidopterella palustris CBS 459.81 TaxID=1314670 RepID=A0A8E2EL96_9PEZI|nr:hypothetical protein K432DRAFT_377049 [Lepidopterella palustris CBS 459.81]